MEQSSPLSLSEKRQRLVALLQDRARRKGIHPLSLAQRRLWFLAQLVPDHAFYNMPGSLQLDGEINIVSLEQSLREVVRRHETLRTSFLVQDGEPSQYIESGCGSGIDLVDLRGLDDLLRERIIQQVTQEEAGRSFNLSMAPLLRLRLLWIAQDKFLLLMNLHHIISDGWSQGLLIKELSELQIRFQAGQQSALEELAFQYVDYARWQQNWLSGDRYQQQLSYWQRQLEGMVTLQLPYDYPRPPVQSFRGAFEVLPIEEALLNNLRGIARASGVSLFTVLLTGFAIVLHRYSGQNDIVIGTPTANRDALHTEHLIGFFVNMLVLRIAVSSEITLGDMIKAVSEVCRGAYDHQDFPFEKLVEEAQPIRDLSKNPIFQVAFVQLTELEIKSNLGNAIATSHIIASETSKFDLQVNVQEGIHGGRLLIEYSTDLFKPETIRRLFKHYKELLRSVAGNLGEHIGSLDLLDHHEWHQQIEGWNDTASPYNRSICLQEAFERQVLSHPDAAAVICGDHVTTYSALNDTSNQLAHFLRTRDIGRQDRVGVLLHRTAHMVSALLGILKSGAMYVPLDVGWPSVRISQILRSLNIATLVTDLDCLPKLTEIDQSTSPLRQLIFIDPAEGHDIVKENILNMFSSSVQMIWPDGLKSFPTENLPSLSTPQDPAYIIFTSGSTGTPKGVVVSHQAVINLIEWVTKTFGVGPNDEILLVASLCFDLSVYDIFGLLAAGGRIRIAREIDLEEPDRLASLLLSSPISFWDSAPAALRRVLDFVRGPDIFGNMNLRLAFLSGDWIPVPLPDIVRTNFPKVRVIGLGGATEATVWSNWFPIEEVDPNWISIPYGRPIQNASYYILDPQMNPCPIGVKGDLYIGGDCLFMCYENEAELTAIKLVPDPFGQVAGGRLYRTGDCARFWADGNIEFLGRIDGQVKIRGHRIELGEVEFHLRQHSGVSDCVAIAQITSSGEKQLVAYYIASETPPPDPKALRQHLRMSLPEYMVPCRIFPVQEIPLSKNGKVDRDRLSAQQGVENELGFIEPFGQTEEIVADVWRKVLSVDRVSADGNFFDLGGHSLVATKLIARLRERFQLNLPLKLLFEHPTIAEISREIEAILVREIESLSDDQVQQSLDA